MIVLETERLVLRHLTADDAELMFALMNDPAWLQYIGDRGIRTLDDARNYILTGPMDMYARFGFGMYLTERKADGVPIGICGLVKRDELEHPDVGFAFLPPFRSQGYGFEAGSAALAYARSVLGLEPILAITSLDNHTSRRLLEKLGLHFTRTIHFKGEELKLFST